MYADFLQISKWFFATKTFLPTSILKHHEIHIIFKYNLQIFERQNLSSKKEFRIQSIYAGSTAKILVEKYSSFFNSQ